MVGRAALTPRSTKLLTSLISAGKVCRSATTQFVLDRSRRAEKDDKLMKTIAAGALLSACVSFSAANLEAQVVNPATAQPGASSSDQKPDSHHTWEMAPVDVFGKAPI